MLLHHFVSNYNTKKHDKKELCKHEIYSAFYTLLLFWRWHFFLSLVVVFPIFNIYKKLSWTLSDWVIDYTLFFCFCVFFFVFFWICPLKVVDKKKCNQSRKKLVYPSLNQSFLYWIAVWCYKIWEQKQKIFFLSQIFFNQ